MLICFIFFVILQHPATSQQRPNPIASQASQASQQANKPASQASQQAKQASKPASQQASKPREMSAVQKNFVVSFRNDSGNINAIMEGGFGKNIMDIMIAISSYGDFEEAKKQKILCIQDYIYKNMKHIDFLVYLYGNSLVIQEYINRFGPIVYSPILEVDFATIIIDNIIVIYEAREFPENTTPKSLIDSSVQYNSQDIEEMSDNHEEYDIYSSYSGGEEDEEEMLSTSQLIYKYDDKLTEEDIIKFLTEN